MSLMAQILAAEWVKIRLTFFSPPRDGDPPLVQQVVSPQSGEHRRASAEEVGVIDDELQPQLAGEFRGEDLLVDRAA